MTAKELIDFAVDGGEVTEAGVRTNIDVAIQYLASWLRGTGAAALYNLMEDVATAEISRSQIWQWVHNGVVTVEGVPVARGLGADHHRGRDGATSRGAYWARPPSPPVDSKRPDHSSRPSLSPTNSPSS